MRVISALLRAGARCLDLAVLPLVSFPRVAHCGTASLPDSAMCKPVFVVSLAHYDGSKVTDSSMSVIAVMSSNGEHTTVMQGVTHGACDFLIKPVRIEELRNIWQHVIRRSRHQQVGLNGCSRQ